MLPQILRRRIGPLLPVCDLEIEWMMAAAVRIERRPAGRACVAAFEVLTDRQYRSTSTAQHRALVPFAAWPGLDRVAGQSVMTILAGVIDAATLHLDGDHVLPRSVMDAARLRIDTDATNGRMHPFRNLSSLARH